MIAKSVSIKYQEENLNGGLLSDYERDMCNRRLARSPDHYLRLKEALLIFFDQLLEKERIDLVIYEGVSNAFAYFCNIVCRSKAIRYVGLQNARIPRHFVLVSDEIGYVSGYAEALKRILAEKLVVLPEIKEWSRRYIDNSVCKPPDYMGHNAVSELSLRKRYLKREKVDKALLILRHVWRDNRYSAWRGNPLYFSLRQVWRNALRRVKRSMVLRYYQPPATGVPYVLYPLHFHPEASTSMQAGAYLNEYEVVRNIAFNLPEGYTLFVKDHISAYAYPPLAFYRALARLPNVCLLSPFEDTKSLIRGCAAVITLTSTVGFEALLLGKRVFLFGRTFYDFHRNVIKIANPNNLYKLLKCELAKNTVSDDTYNLAFLAAYKMTVYEGELRFFGDEFEIETTAARIYPVICAGRSQEALGVPVQGAAD